MDFLLKQRFLSCALNNQEAQKPKESGVSLYVKITDSCNANCSFCEFHNAEKNFRFNFDKFVAIINTIKKQTPLRKISFTGGEPTTNRPLLDKCLGLVKRMSNDSFVVVNTNGLFLKWLSARKEVDSISLSRHHYSDRRNKQCFKTTSIANFNNICSTDKTKIHLSCNLIKGYIASKAQIVEYLEHAISLGIKDVGFVSLMPVNKYAEKNRIDFDNIKLKHKHIVNNMQWRHKDACKCKNFLYLPRKGRTVVKFYCRYRCNHTEATEGTYMYDGEYLRDNFNGNIIW